MDCENDSSNHVENTPKSLDGTAESPKNSPIPFRNMPRGRRRNTNKTGKSVNQHRLNDRFKQKSKTDYNVSKNVILY